MSHTDTEYCKIAFDHTCNGILVVSKIPSFCEYWNIVNIRYIIRIHWFYVITGFREHSSLIIFLHFQYPQSVRLGSYTGMLHTATALPFLWTIYVIYVMYRGKTNEFYFIKSSLNLKNNNHFYMSSWKGEIIAI